MNRLPLDRVRIADFSWQIAGPTCTRYLGALGAEVIRIESNRRPDPYRQRSISQFINQNKKSVTLNLAEPEGLALAKQLISVSDVFIENFAPGVIERLGLGYAELKKVRPEIIMLSSAGLGHSGPDMHQVAYGTLIQCFTGWSVVQGYPDGEPDIGGIWTDPMVGMLEVFLINAALYRCGKTGEGQYIDLSMAEATTMLLPELILDYAMNGRLPQPLGNRHQSFAPHGNYPCRGDDQWIGIAVTSERQWEALARTVGRPELLEDPRFADPIGRWRNQKALDHLLAATTRQWDGLELMEELQRAGVPAGAALPLNQFWDNAHLRSRGFFHNYREQDEPGTRRELPTVPWRFNGSREAKIDGQPRRGQHNGYIFNQLLGLSEETVEALAEQRVIY